MVQYEVVTADGSILTVNANTNSDLFWALKGGGANYAIVTRFDCKTYPIGNVWGGYISQDAAHVPQLLDATASYTAPPTGGAYDDKSAIDVTIYFNGTTKVFSGSTSLFYNASINNPRALQNFTKIPVSAPSTTKIQSYTDFEQNTASSGDRTFRCV